MGPNVATGTFGNWEETGRFINLAINVGACEGKGYGESVGSFIENEGLVIPSESSDSRPLPARHRKISWTTLFALIALLALIGTVIAVGMRSDPSPQVTRSVVPRPARPAIPPEVRRFGEIAAELRVGIDRYDERARDFDLGRIGCDLLTTGYGVVDESFIRLVAMRAQIDREAGTGVASEFEQLSQEVDDVNGHFDASGCPRPE